MLLYRVVVVPARAKTSNNSMEQVGDEVFNWKSQNKTALIANDMQLQQQLPSLLLLFSLFEGICFQGRMRRGNEFNFV